jgi:ribosomal small subunit protein bTHX
MGKGDKKTKKGKIRKDSYGNSRSRKALKARLKRSNVSKPKAATVEVEEKPKKAAAKKKADA